jgi:nucleoside-diphosphate-sugar epimerase
MMGVRLILGGSWFLGRAIADTAVEAGHEVTVFQRGRSGPDPDGVPAVRRDRESAESLVRLAGRGPWYTVMTASEGFAA